MEVVRKSRKIGRIALKLGVSVFAYFGFAFQNVLASETINPIEQMACSINLIPNTGDDSNNIIWIILGLIAVLGAVGLLVFKKITSDGKAKRVKKK